MTNKPDERWSTWLVAIPAALIAAFVAVVYFEPNDPAIATSLDALSAAFGDLRSTFSPLLFPALVMVTVVILAGMAWRYFARWFQGPG
jgi:hypothetical protein